MDSNIPKLNMDLLLTRLKEIQVGITTLQRYKHLKTEDFIKNNEAVSASKYELIVLIEAVSIICTHITVRRMDKVSDTYAECYTLLHEAGIISKELSERLQKMARFRNLLVHRYHKIDDSRVHEVIKQDIGDIIIFKDKIKKYIKE